MNPGAKQPAVAVRCGELILRQASCRAESRGHDVGLTVTEFNAVTLLVENEGTFVNCRAICDRVRYDGFHGGNGEDGYKVYVRASLKIIRRKFCTIDPDFTGIVNQGGGGYAWRVADVDPKERPVDGTVPA